jgi:hypothetical protein
MPVAIATPGEATVVTPHDAATVTRQKDGRLVRAEAYGYSPEFIEHLCSLCRAPAYHGCRILSIKPGPNNPVGVVWLSLRIVASAGLSSTAHE